MHIRQMTVADIPFGLHLGTQNRWNQLEADWRRQLALEPEGCFVAEVDGQPIGTACTCIFGDVAWINLVLVEREQRGRGIGTALLRHVIDHLDKLGVPTIRLDATPLGQPVYAKFGFVGEFTLTRFEGAMPLTSDSVTGIESLTDADLPAVLQMDEAITQTSRAKLLRHFYGTGATEARKVASAGRLEGYCMARPGANAWHIGPLQGTPDACRPLLFDAARRYAGRFVYLDVPTDNGEASSLVKALGLTPQRSFLRMARGRRLREELSRYWAAFGPEKG